MEIRKVVIWDRCEYNIKRLLHQVNHKNIPIILRLFSKNNQGSKELYSKIFTFLPIHVEYLNHTDLIMAIEIGLNRGYCSDRLLRSFFCKRLENIDLSLSLYLKVIKLLARHKYQVNKSLILVR